MKPDKEVVERKVESTLRVAGDGDGRTVEGLVVPYGKPAFVNDHDGQASYEEEWVKGAFRNNLRAPNQVLVNFEHYGARYDDVMVSGGSIDGVLGRGLELEERDDGLYGKFRIFEGASGDNALRLIREGVVTAFSVAAKPLRSLRTQAGVVQRVKAHLDWVSLARVGAFPESQILAVRTKALLEEEQKMPEPAEEMLLRFAARGLEIPEELTPTALRAQKMLDRAANAEAESANALQDAISALNRYKQTEPDPEDLATADQYISTLEDLLAKDQAEEAAA